MMHNEVHVSYIVPVFDLVGPQHLVCMRLAGSPRMLCSIVNGLQHLEFLVLVSQRVHHYCVAG